LSAGALLACGQYFGSEGVDDDVKISPTSDFRIEIGSCCAASLPISNRILVPS
jgi:hypothetical protein